MLKLLISSYCELCGKELRYNKLRLGICEDCISKIEFINFKDSCRRCSLPDVKDDCPYCKNLPFSISRNISLFKYNGFVKDIFFQLKFGNDRSKVKLFHRLIERLNLSDIINDQVNFIVPVPSSPLIYIKRGFSVVNDIFKPISRIWKVEFLDILGRKLFYKSQKKLSKLEREIVVRSQFFIKRKVDLDGKVVLVVDDVFTTGSTVNVCGNLVMSMGARKVYSLTLFRADLI